MRRWTAALLIGPAVLFLVGGFVGPLTLALGESLRGGIGPYVRIFGDSYYLEVIAATLALSGTVTLAALAVGYPYALILARAQGWAKTVLLFLLVAPLLVNVVVRSFGWMVIFGRSGLVNAALDLVGLPKLDLLNSWTAIGIALVHVLLPFMVLSIAATLEDLDPALEEAAATLGARPLRRFIHIVAPLSLHGAVTGAILVFALCMGSFVTVMMMGDNRTMVLPLLVYQQLSVAGDGVFAAALGMVLLATVLAVFWLQARAVRTLTP
ncbi:MAG: ABC transporter permease [Alphaproteobacteria bacterium]|nr:ABC transporter permease [Alphaproteobacteria bacterium]